MSRLPYRSDWTAPYVDAAVHRAMSHASLLCVLHGPDARPDAGWYVFLFDEGVQSAVRQGEHLIVAYLEPDEADPGFSGRIVGMVHEDLMASWWGGDRSVPSIAPGSYFPTAAMEALIAATARMETTSPAARLRAEAQTQELLCETMDAWRSNALVPTGGEMVLHREERERLTRARKMIETQFADKITIEGLARACGLGRARLIRGFKLLFGETVAECLAERRLQAAASALRRTRQPVSQIAFQSGYLSNAAFTRAFARRFGAVPSAFRVAPLAA